ncbi:hypothetical protein AURDEDRAFT_118037 [Auricularia subglabra TFB-10046 SS5]|uniref:Uncharacterized protein n=1 Tax=Auricularia subglabra (strain TFB-10046 / SS5) TaxID=717982 RepID=J0L851_AURST|nr:hypothetical protein AURDEDRAFT_118037 [Auricularia subglabra TFB-10046 SS5]
MASSFHAPALRILAIGGIQVCKPVVDADRRNSATLANRTVRRIIKLLVLGVKFVYWPTYPTWYVHFPSCLRSSFHAPRTISRRPADRQRMPSGPYAR